MHYSKFTLIRHNIYYVKHVKTKITPNNPTNKSVIYIINRAVVFCTRVALFGTEICWGAGGVDTRVLVIINPPKISHHANRSEKAGKNQ